MVMTRVIIRLIWIKFKTIPPILQKAWMRTTKGIWRLIPQIQQKILKVINKENLIPLTQPSIWMTKIKQRLRIQRIKLKILQKLMIKTCKMVISPVIIRLIWIKFKTIPTILQKNWMRTTKGIWRLTLQIQL